MVVRPVFYTDQQVPVGQAAPAERGRPGGPSLPARFFRSLDSGDGQGRGSSAILLLYLPCVSSYSDFWVGSVC